MIVDATEVGCTNKYDFSELIGPIKNQITPGTHDLDNFGGVRGIATSRAPFYGFDGTEATYMASSGTWGLTDTFTIEAIFSISATTGADQSICGDISAATGAGWLLNYEEGAGTVSFTSWSSFGVSVIRSATAAAITLGTVYHITITFDKTAGGSNTKLYLNGALNVSGMNGNSPVTGTYFSVSDVVTATPLRGRVFLVRIFNRTLTSLEAEQNFEAERWRIPHTIHTWAASPSVAATHTYARMFNIANQYADLARDIGPVQATQIVATTDSVKKAGADFICDETADDVEIQAALDAAHAVGGGTVMILDGTYNLAAPVRVYDNVTLCGAGRATILSTVGGGTTKAITNDDLDMGNTGIVIRDLSITSAGGGVTPTVDGIYLSGCIAPPYVSVQKVHFTNTFNGITVLYCEHVTIEGCSCRGATNGSQLVNCDSSGYVHIVGCSALEFACIYLIDSYDCMVRSCVVTTHTIFAYYIFRCEHCAVIGCSASGDATGRPTAGVYVEGGVQNLICGNSLYYASNANIAIEANTAGTVVIGNACSGAGMTDGRGIFVAVDCLYTNLSGNSVSNNHLDGVGSDDGVGVTLSYGCVNDNTAYYNGANGIALFDTIATTMNGNVSLQNGSTTDNTGSNLAFATGAGGGASENIAFGNTAMKGAAAPQTYAGFWVGTGSNNNLITANYLVGSGKTQIIADGGTGTDTTAWKVAGNKIA